MQRIRNAFGVHKKDPGQRALKHTKSMPLRNYPISGPITLQNQNDSYLAMSYDPSKPQVTTNQKSYQRFVTHTAVGDQTVPNDIMDDDDDYGDLIDMYASSYTSTPAPRGYMGNGVSHRSPSPTSGSGSRGRTPAFPLKHSNSSTPAIVHRTNRLNSPSSTSVNDKSQEPRQRLHSRFSKPLPPHQQRRALSLACQSFPTNICL
ncbi:hypothetical protein BDZ89DRAFT_410563 [Hymenopellis radicata]|nr:hypothetical protein BDZ89DRAFT_410563 [Hymenopellis radicata]